MLLNELFHHLQLSLRATFKSTRIMKYELWVTLKDQLILDVMQSTLHYHNLLVGYFNSFGQIKPLLKAQEV